MPSDYFIPAKPFEIEYEIKKSRFIAHALYASNRQQAMVHLDQSKSHYPDARHHCWAYLIGAPSHPTTMAQSDDGEPSGTAGKPILNVLQHKCVGDVMLIVVRYFGGIKLGAGGLVRAYSHTAQLAMEKLTLKEKLDMAEVAVECGFHQEQELRHWLSSHEGSITSIEYTNDVIIFCTFPSKHQSALLKFTKNRRFRIIPSA